ncbi:MAG: polyribonucleotide nucleotidyltransferase [Candidatus Manganitrophus sp.]|nr:polyribonucleotide nucleotidyltransferase [Candidatus Manganitrophus sp.]WDT72998.1 MAG: polyribonucleotide nucleotidyltransferase [Candidatus Manganitrophus sp.]
MVHRVEAEIAGKKLVLETGRMARQADGAVLVQYGESMVLATAVASKQAKDVDFLPLTVDYQERAYAAGRIPGGFFKREGRLSEKETLTSRLIDRPMRPLFPDHWYFETQIIASVLSSDLSASTEILGMVGASAAVTISDIPFNGPIGAIRVGRIDGKLVAMPSLEEIEKSDMNIVLAGTAEAVMMVESEIKELPEEAVLEAVAFGHQALQTLIGLQKELQAKVGKQKRSPVAIDRDEAFEKQLRETLIGPIQEAILISNKTERQERLDHILEEKIASINTGEVDRTREIKALFHELEREAVREMILTKGVRADGRGPADIRSITCEVGILPRTHGSALFTRGETQSLAVVTLGTSDDEQRIDSLEGEWKKTFMLHYNFPPFSVGEARPLRGPGRREIGHGALAERALKPIIPSKEAFPYTLRIVSDVLESNGSSSMATVCGGTLALMDAGVPIVRPVAGIAMGLILEGKRVQILSDILGLEDHLGDMDFKVTGTAQGITAFQLDIKIGGLTIEIMKRALEQARQGRQHILGKMLEALAAPRPELSTYAPRIVTMKVKPDKVREVIGPGGKVIRGIIEKTGVKIDIEDDGTIHIASMDDAAAKEAIEMVNMIVEEVEVGRVYVGKVTRIMDFGAIVELRRGVDGLVHISQLAHHRVKNVTDEVKEGDEITVKVLEVDRQGKIRLSRKETLPPLQKKVKCESLFVKRNEREVQGLPFHV